jgi:hypothetical protein
MNLNPCNIWISLFPSPLSVVKFLSVVVNDPFVLFLGQKKLCILQCLEYHQAAEHIQ